MTLEISSQRNQEWKRLEENQSGLLPWTLAGAQCDVWVTSNVASLHSLKLCLI